MKDKDIIDHLFEVICFSENHLILIVGLNCVNDLLKLKKQIWYRLFS